MELTRKQIAFGNEYINNPNVSATQAAINAGYSEKGAFVQASLLLENIKVKAFIKKRREEQSKILDVNVDRVVRELANISFSNVTDFIKVDGDNVTLTDWSLLTKDQTACIESVNKTKEGYRLKLYSKATAIELLGKYFNMWNAQIKPDEEPDQFKDMSNEQLDRFIESNGAVQ